MRTTTVLTAVAAAAPAFAWSSNSWARRSLADDDSLQARYFDEDALEARGLYDDDYLQARGFDDDDYLQARGFDDDSYLQARGLDDNDNLQARGFDADGYLQVRGPDDEDMLQGRGLDDHDFLQARETEGASSLWARDPEFMYSREPVGQHLQERHPPTKEHWHPSLHIIGSAMDRRADWEDVYPRMDGEMDWLD